MAKSKPKSSSTAKRRGRPPNDPAGPSWRTPGLRLTPTEEDTMRRYALLEGLDPPRSPGGATAILHAMLADLRRRVEQREKRRG